MWRIVHCGLRCVAHSGMRTVGYGVWRIVECAQWATVCGAVRMVALCGWWRCVALCGWWRCVAYKRNARGVGFGRLTLYRPAYYLIVPYTSSTKFLKFLKFSPATLCARIATPRKIFIKFLQHHHAQATLLPYLVFTPRDSGGI